jgi:hypothetical protein
MRRVFPAAGTFDAAFESLPPCGLSSAIAPAVSSPKCLDLAPVSGIPYSALHSEQRIPARINNGISGQPLTPNTSW